MSRALRPAHLQLVSGELWAIDAIQPVAAVLDPATGELLRVAAWPEVPPWHVDPGVEWRALSDGDALWVQSGDGPPGRVTPDGEVVVATVRTNASAERWQLAAAGPSGAWLLGPEPRQDIAGSADAPPPTDGVGQLLVASPVGEVRHVLVQHAVHGAVGADEGVALQVDTGRGERIDIGMDSWSWEPEHEWLLIPWSDDVPEFVSKETHAIVPPPRSPSARLSGWPFMWHDDLLDAGPTQAQRVDVAGGLVWRLGWDLAGSTPRRSLGTGHDPISGAEHLRVDLGAGTVLAVLGTPDRLFVVLADPGRSAALLAVDPVTGQTLELLPGGPVDVSAHCRPVGGPPADFASYTRYWLRYWADDAGDVEPAEQGMSNGRAELVGEWPSTAVEITFDWAPRPGVRLRRRLPLFDELGRHTPPEYSDIHLTEDLATGQIPPAPADHLGGVLDV